VTVVDGDIVTLKLIDNAHKEIGTDEVKIIVADMIFAIFADSAEPIVLLKKALN